MKNILVKNSIFGLIQTLINSLLVFFVIPIFINMLGMESYGAFALIMVVGNLNSFANLGLNNALIKFIAEQGPCEESNMDIVVNIILIVIILLPLSIVLFLLDEFILHTVLKVPFALLSESKWLYFWVLWANFILLIGQVFKSILDAVQKIYITSLQQVIYNISYWILILIVLILGYKLAMIGFVIFISAAIWFIITMISVFKEWGKLSFTGLDKHFKKAATKQLKYGLQIYSGGLIGFFYEPLSKILISNFIGVAEVGFYDIALKLRSQLWSLIAKIFYPLFPFISEQKELGIVRKYVHDLEQKTFFIITPIIAILILLMPTLIDIWLGTDVNIISMTAIYIISFHLIGSSSVIPNYQFLMAKNLAGKTIVLQLSNVIINTILFLLAIKNVGYYALIIGNVGAIMSSFILSLYYQKKYLNSLIFDNTLQVLKLLIVFIAIVLIGQCLKIILHNNDALMIIFIPIIIVFATMLLYRLFELINSNDIHRYFGKNNRLSKIMCHIYDN